MVKLVLHKLEQRPQTYPLSLCMFESANSSPVLVANTMAYRKAANGTQFEQFGSMVSSFNFTPGFGSPGFDYGAMVTGTPEDMAKLLGHSRDGSTGKLLTEAGYTEHGDCSVDLHRSLLMVSH